MATTNETMKALRFGTEIEFTSISRSVAINAVASVVSPGATINHGIDHGLDCFSFIDSNDRKWMVVSDGSVNGYGTGGEFVTPPLHFEDIAMVQECVRALRRAGAVADSSCGQHVHVDGAQFISNPRKVRNLIALCKRWENIMLAASPIRSGRDRWCRRLESSLVERFRRTGGRTMRTINTAWYGSFQGSASHYDSSRYHWLNVHSLCNGVGTVEFRLFDGTLHAGKVRTNIVLAMAIAALALNSRSVSFRATGFAATKSGMREVMYCLGLTGEEMGNVRKHLTDRLPAGPKFIRQLDAAGLERETVLSHTNSY